MAASSLVLVLLLEWKALSLMETMERQSIATLTDSAGEATAADLADAVRFKTIPKIEETLTSAMVAIGDVGVSVTAYDADGTALETFGTPVDQPGQTAQAHLALGRSRRCPSAKHLTNLFSVRWSLRPPRPTGWQTCGRIC